MAKPGVTVPLTQLEVPKEDDRYCSTCAVRVGKRIAVFGFVGFLELEEGAVAWKEKLFCAVHAPAVALRHLKLVRG